MFLIGGLSMLVMYKHVHVIPFKVWTTSNETRTAYLADRNHWKRKENASSIAVFIKIVCFLAETCPVILQRVITGRNITHASSQLVAWDGTNTFINQRNSPKHQRYGWFAFLIDSCQSFLIDKSGFTWFYKVKLTRLTKLTTLKAFRRLRDMRYGLIFFTTMMLTLGTF